MALLEDFEGDQLEPAQLGGSKAVSPRVAGEEEESFQMHRPKKDKRYRLTDEGKKLSSLSLRRGKPKDPGVEKMPKRGKHVRSKSGSRTPPDSPKSTRAAAESGRKASKPTIGQLQPSPNVKSTRKRYAVLGKDTVSTGSESGEENGLMVSNQAVAGGHAHQVDPVKTEDAPSSPTGLHPFFPPPQPSSPHFPVPFFPQPELTPEIPAPQETFAAQNPLSHELSPGQPPGNFFMSPMPPPLLQPSSVATPPTSSQDADWTISEELKTKCSHQFAELCPEDGRLSGDKARTFFVQSRLPNQELSQIWRLSDWDKDNALSEPEFCVAMKLVLMRRRGHAIPASLPDSLRPPNQEGLFSDSFVPPMQPLPPPPLRPSHRPRPPKATQSSMELSLPPEEKQSGPVAAVVTEPAPTKVPLSKVVQQSAPDLLKARDSEDSHVTNPIYVEVNDQSTSDVGPLVPTEEEEEEEGEEETSDPPVGRIISYESANESEEGEESSAIVQTRRRTSSEGSTRTPPLLLKPSVPSKPANLGRSKSLRQAPELPPRPVPPSADDALFPASGESESTPMISVQGASPKPTSRRLSRPGTLATKSKKYQTIGSGSPSPTSPTAVEEPVDKDGAWLEPVPPSLPSKRGHGRSASLDLKRVMSPDVVADVPPAVPPPPPPKPHLSPSSEKPAVRRRSASTSSISSPTPTAAVSVDKRSTTPEDHSMDTSTHKLLDQSVSPPPKPRQPTKKAPIFPPKPRRPPPPVKPKLEAEAEVAEPSKTLEYRPVRSKSQLQVTIRSLKETNATLTAINQGLEEKLFMLMEERVKLSRELELAQTAQH